MAAQILQRAERTASEANHWRRIGEGYAYLSAHVDALRCYEKGAALSPDDANCLYDLATAVLTTGDVGRAEKLLDQVIAIDPSDADAWYNRSTLRRQSVERNHVLELKSMAHSVANSAKEPAICYALAKELEDINAYSEAFKYLSRGADARRKRLSYNVEHDVAAMRQIAEVFGGELFRSQPPIAPGPGPIFILGLPRSGSTLVERILSSHSDVASLGEIPDFALALTIAMPPGNKSEMIQRAGNLDFNMLGREYQRRVRGYGKRKPFQIDKTPSNFLYIGLIALALPHAKIIYLRREPLDVCLAMYKTLFRMGYPFSYSQADLAAYYTAHHRLMEHWRSVLPGRIIEVDYERLVADQEGETRQLLANLGLAWERNCLDFHRNADPSATASAVQVRQPIHTRSVGLWRQYERELAPLTVALSAEGIIGAGR